MSSATSIQWTDATWNPVTGCTKVSPGCKHCYAETIANRLWAKQYPGRAGFTEVRTHADRLDDPLRWRKPKRVFVNSMSDLFHEDVPVTFIGMILDIVARTPQHTYQVLTKRPDGFANSFRGPVEHAIGTGRVAVDLVQLADGLADLDYVVEGTRLECGIDREVVEAEVHRANMAKFGPGSVRREDGKILKPEGWMPPDIAGCLNAMRKGKGCP